MIKSETTKKEQLTALPPNVGSKSPLWNDIYHGDSFKLCEKIEAKSVDMILEDMPYGTTACEWDTKINLNLYWETRLRILKPTGAVVLTASQPFTSFLVMSNLKMFKYEWIWNKTFGKEPFAKNKRPQKAHESILIFYTEQPIFNGIKRKGKPYIDRRINQKIKSEHYIKDRVGIVNNGEREPISVIDFPMANFEDMHPTQKPVGLFEYPIRTYTNEGDLVFDGFGGSGTTAIAAHRAKRNFIVIEKDLEYYEKSKKRLEIEQAQQTFF